MYLYILELQNTLEVSLFQSHQCFLSRFFSEFLLCCGNNDKINCFRNDITNFGIINSFIINLSGSIKNILITNKIDHVIISYKNDDSSNKNYNYNYYIFQPKCNNISIKINSFQNIEINLIDLFNRITNTKYYISFLSMAPNYGIIKLEQTTITSLNNKIEITTDMNKLYYIFSNTYEVINNFDIIYNISIEETYSSTCKISIIANNNCYHSCRGCNERTNIIINENEHNCLNCNEESNYFPYTEKPNNCYTKEEMEQNFIR